MDNGMELLNRWIEVAAIRDEDWITRQLSLGPLLEEADRMRVAQVQLNMPGNPYALGQYASLQNMSAQHALAAQQAAALQNTQNVYGYGQGMNSLLGGLLGGIGRGLGR